MSLKKPLVMNAGQIQQLQAADTLEDLDSNARVAVRKNTGGTDVGKRRRLNFIEGTNVTLTVVDDAGSEEVDITIASSAGAADTAGGKWLNYKTFQ